jgi:hypothetical protein
VIGSPESLAPFAGAADLAAYLHTAHPPQRPGALDIEDCQALAAFLVEANSPRQPTPPQGGAATPWALASFLVCAIVLATIGLLARRGA